MQILPSIFSYRLSTLYRVIGLVMFLSGCLYMPRKLSVPAEFVQCKKYKELMLRSSSKKGFLLSLCPIVLGHKKSGSKINIKALIMFSVKLNPIFRKNSLHKKQLPSLIIPKIIVKHNPQIHIRRK